MDKYKIVDPNVDYRKAVIEKTEVGSVRFTLEEVEAYQAKYSEKKRELQAQIEIEKAKIANIEEHHPFVKDLSPEDLFTVWLYVESSKLVENNEKGIEAIVGALDQYQTEREEIMQALGFQKAQ